MTFQVTDEMVEAGSNAIAKTRGVVSSVISRQMHAWADDDARAVIIAVAPLIEAQARAIDERKVARRAVRLMQEQVKLEWRPGQHVMTPGWYAEGAIQEAIREAVTGEVRR